MIKTRYVCTGQYCHVVLEDGALAAPKTAGVTKKSILLDRYENPVVSCEDPLGLESRKFLSLDFLMAKIPNLRPSNFYEYCKVCKNCQLAYSIIDCSRNKVLRVDEPENRNRGLISCNTLLQTRLGVSQMKLSQSVSKMKKKLKEKRNTEYENLKNILVPVGHTRMSKVAEELLQSMIPDGYHNRINSKRTRTHSRGSEKIETEPVCELALSVLRKRIYKSGHFIKYPKHSSKTFPKMG